jgi:hypothetical protein
MLPERTNPVSGIHCCSLSIQREQQIAFYPRFYYPPPK